jgi:hypothetical protein
LPMMVLSSSSKSSYDTLSIWSLWWLPMMIVFRFHQACQSVGHHKNMSMCCDQHAASRKDLPGVSLRDPLASTRGRSLLIYQCVLVNLTCNWQGDKFHQ